MADIVGPFIRPPAAASRGLPWPGWELLFGFAGWGVGRCVCRAVTFGRPPDVAPADGDGCDFAARLPVEALGAATLGSAVWLLARAPGA